MLYTVGDTHGNQYKWVEQIEPILSPSDIILICGDFGVGFGMDVIGLKKHFMIFLVNKSILCCS